jgi:hypothetical protein
MPTFEDPFVERIYQDGLRRIERVRARLQYEGDILVLPTVCGQCEQSVMELEMIADGDGLPLCKRCFDGFCNALCAE